MTYYMNYNEDSDFRRVTQTLKYNFVMSMQIITKKIISRAAYVGKLEQTFKT